MSSVSQLNSVQSLRRIQLFVTPWTTAHQASLSITNSRSLLKLMSIESVIPSNHPLPSPFPPAFSLSQHQEIFQWVSPLHQVAKQSIKASASASVLPKNIQDWFPLGWTGWIPLLSKRFSWVFSRATVRKHLFFGIQSSYGPTLHPYMTTGKTIALTRWTFVSKVMSLFFSMLSGLW